MRSQYCALHYSVSRGNNNNTGLALKLSKIVSPAYTRTIMMLLQNRQFCVDFDNNRSKWHKQKNGLPQGSVLVPMLFNIFTSDWPPTATCKFVHADDVCLAAQSTDRTSIETTLTEDLSKVAEYCKVWRLKPNPTKTVVGYFHSANKVTWEIGSETWRYSIKTWSMSSVLESCTVMGTTGIPRWPR